MTNPYRGMVGGGARLKRVGGGAHPKRERNDKNMVRIGLHWLVGKHNKNNS
jgi:hypothetical protein